MTDALHRKACRHTAKIIGTSTRRVKKELKRRRIRARLDGLTTSSTTIIREDPTT
jgi:hypothetical protein